MLDTVKINVRNGEEDRTAWNKVQPVHAAYGPDGLTFDRTDFVDSYGEQLAGYLETALTEFGQAATAVADQKGYGTVESTYDFEDGNGEWTLSAVEFSYSKQRR